jgi:hypothetical protein
LLLALVPTAMHQREGRHDTASGTPALFTPALAAAGLERPAGSSARCGHGYPRKDHRNGGEHPGAEPVARADRPAIAHGH